MGFSTNHSYFTLTAYSDPGPLRWLYFLILMSVYALIVLSNLLLIVVICLNRTLHEPMYIFLCSLFLNELYGSTALFPFLLVQILRDEHKLSHTFCFLQIFCIYVYANVQLLMLALMSYDRYLAICFPLQYHTRMSSCRVLRMVALSWLFVLVEVGFMVSLSAPLELCGNLIPKVYCDNYPVVKLACGDTSVNNIYGLLYTFLFILSILFILFYTYIRILKVCFSGSKQTRYRALSTCTPHIASFTNFCFAGFFEIIQSRFDMSAAPNALRVFMSLYFLTVQPLFNPMVYGLKLSKIRLICKSLFVGEVQ